MSTGDYIRGQLLEEKDRGRDQGVSQVEDLLQEEGEHSSLPHYIFNQCYYFCSDCSVTMTNDI